MTFPRRAFSFFVLIFLSMQLDAQEKSIYDVETLKIEEHIYDSIVQFDFIEPHLNGIGWLRKHVEDNLEDFPMEEAAISSSRDKQHEAHKRWERYMRKLPVKVYKIEDIQKALEVKCSITETITVCKNFQDVMELTFENHSTQPLSFEFALSYNSFIQYPDDSENLDDAILKVPSANDKFNYVGNGRATITISPNQEIKVSLPVNYSCDGKGGELYKTSFPSNFVEINYDIKLNGYTYNKDKKELYMLATSNLDLIKLKLEY